MKSSEASGKTSANSNNESESEDNKEDNTDSKDRGIRYNYRSCSGKDDNDEEEVNGDEDDEHICGSIEEDNDPTSGVKSKFPSSLTGQLKSPPDKTQSRGKLFLVS